MTTGRDKPAAADLAVANPAEKTEGKPTENASAEPVEKTDKANDSDKAKETAVDDTASGEKKE